MNTQKVTGRRFSKVRTLKVEREEDSPPLDKHLAEELEKYLAEKRPRSLPEVIAYYIKFAQTRLQSSGLPTAPLLHWTDNEKQPLPGSGGRNSSSATLPAYIGSIEKKGSAKGKKEPEPKYERDSPERLAAEIIWTAHRLDTAQPGEQRDWLLFNLGKLWTLFRVNSMTAAASWKAATGPRPKAQKVTDEVLTDLADKEQKNKRDAASIIAKKYKVTASAIRRAKNKKSAT